MLNQFPIWNFTNWSKYREVQVLNVSDFRSREQKKQLFSKKSNDQNSYIIIYMLLKIRKPNYVTRFFLLPNDQW
ncbi:hypothetical protein BDB01DRAFT_795739 [Pilobolus umbonatus]|nr:hypothetical protein BDB01DRAFT_795739 [Pilobolus umbonatus]